MTNLTFMNMNVILIALSGAVLIIIAGLFSKAFYSKYKDRIPDSSRSWDSYIVVTAGVWLLLVGSYGCNREGFNAIAEIRQFDRAPQVSAASVVNGEVHMSGVVRVLDETHQSGWLDEQSVYHRYEAAIRSDDSWRNIEYGEQAADFLLKDSTGTVLVEAESGVRDGYVSVQAEKRLDVEERHAISGRERNVRFREYRIDPGDSISVFGYAQPSDEGYRIEFQSDGAYTPIISSSGLDRSQRNMMLLSVASTIIGVAALIHALFLIGLLLNLQRSAAFMAFVAGGTLLVLGGQGIQMIADDVQSAHNTTTRAIQSSDQALHDLLRSHGIDERPSLSEVGDSDLQYDGLPSSAQVRIRYIKLQTAQLVERANRYLDEGVGKWVRRYLNLPTVEPIALSPAERNQLDKREAAVAPVRFHLLPGLVTMLLLGIGAVFATKMGVRTIALKRKIERFPISSIAGATYGMTMIQGCVEPDEDEVFETPYTKQKCVWYTYEKYILDSSTNKKPLWDPQRYKNWRADMRREGARHKETQGRSFLCADDTGKMRVLLQDAQIDARLNKLTEKNEWRHVETYIAPGDTVLVWGTATVTAPDHQSLTFAKTPKNNTPLQITSKSKAELVQEYAHTGFSSLTGGLTCGIAVGMVAAGTFLSVGPVLYMGMAGAVFAGATAIVLGVHYNDLISLRQRIEHAFSNIEAALQKRYDVLQSISTAVQTKITHSGRRQELLNARQRLKDDHEEESMTALIREIEDGNQVRDKVIDSSRAANVDVQLQDLEYLDAIDQEIAALRTKYNSVVDHFNVRITQIPEKAFAQFLGLRPRSRLHERTEVAS